MRKVRSFKYMYTHIVFIIGTVERRIRQTNQTIYMNTTKCRAYIQTVFNETLDKCRFNRGKESNLMKLRTNQKKRTHIERKDKHIHMVSKHEYIQRNICCCCCCCTSWQCKSDILKMNIQLNMDLVVHFVPIECLKCMCLYKMYVWKCYFAMPIRYPIWISFYGFCHFVPL